MSLTYRSTQVSAPLTAPSATLGTAYFIRHRRVNLDGQHSKWSESRKIDLGTTVTPEAFGLPSQLLRDELLISADDGTYRIIPRGTSDTGELLVDTYNPAWPIAVNEDTQNSLLSSFNFGSFTASSEPSVTFFVHNSGTNIGSLTFNVVNALNNQVPDEYSGLVKFELLGTFAEFSQSFSTIDNTSFVWQAPPKNLNTIPLTLPQNSFIQLRITLQNLPIGGISSVTTSLAIQAVANQQVFPLSYDSNWALNTFLYDPSKGFDYPFVEASNAGLTLTVKPFLINVNGVLVGRFTDTTFSLPSVGDYDLTISSTGVLQVWASDETIPTNLLFIGSFSTINLAPNFLNYYFLDISPKPDTYGNDLTPESSLLNTVVEYYPEFNVVADCTTPTNAIGVGLSRTSTYATSGTLLVFTNDDTIVKGDFLSCDTGLLIKDTNGFLVALQDEYFGLVLCTTRYNKPALAESVEANNVTVDTTGFAVATSTNLQTHLAESDTALQTFSDFISAYVSPTFQNLYEAASLIVTNATRGAVTFQRGSDTDTDAVFKVKNEAGTDTFVVKGNGEVNAQSILINGINSEAFTTNEKSKLSTLSNKNAVLNGAMIVSQEHGSVADTGSGRYPVDNFPVTYAGTQVIESKQAVVSDEGIGDFAPGFNFAAKYKVNTVNSSLASSHLTMIYSRLEGINTSRFGFGRSWAKTVTISFWVRSSVTGTYCFSMRNSGPSFRSYIKEFTIDVANTWEKKVITIPGDISGTWDISNNVGLDLGWCLGIGTDYQTTPNVWQTGNFIGSSNQVNWNSTLGNTFYLTGVQLEEGEVATEFEHCSYQAVLEECKRYYEVLNVSCRGNIPIANQYIGHTVNFVEKRVMPTAVLSLGSPVNVYSDLFSVYTLTGALYQIYVAAANTDSYWIGRKVVLNSRL